MEQTTYSKTNVETIMQRLRGQKTPYASPKVQPIPPLLSSSSDTGELKTIVKILGTKLKEAYQALSERHDTIHSLEQVNKELSSTAEQMKESLLSKNLQLSASHTEVEEAKFTVEQLEKQLVDERAKKINPPPSPDLPLLREELLTLRSEQVTWQESRKRLESALEQERARGRSEASTSNSHLVRLAMTTKMLEEEIHSLKCERAATIRQFTQLKELNEETKKNLDGEKEKFRQKEEALAASTTTIQELIDTLEKQKKNLESLMREKEMAAEKEATLSSQISHLNSALSQEKASTSALSTSLKAANESFQSLSLQYEQERQLIHELEEKSALLLKEKETAESRVKEVEELLIAKLQSMSQLEEELGDALTRCDDLEHKVQTLEQHEKSLVEDLQKTITDRDTLREKAQELEQKLGQATTENEELKKKAELFERLKKSVAEASQHAHAILRTFGPGTKPSPAETTPCEPLLLPSKDGERSLVEEQFEQHELF